MKTLERRFQTWKPKHVSSSMLVFLGYCKTSNKMAIRLFFQQPPFCSSHDIHPETNLGHIDGSTSPSQDPPVSTRASDHTQWTLSLRLVEAQGRERGW